VRKTIALGTKSALEFRKNIFPKEKTHRNPKKTGSLRESAPGLQNEPGLTREEGYFTGKKTSVPKKSTFLTLYEKRLLRYF